MAQFTMNQTRFDPYKNFKFRVKWDGRYVAGVSTALVDAGSAGGRQAMKAAPASYRRLKERLEHGALRG